MSSKSTSERGAPGRRRSLRAALGLRGVVKLRNRVSLTITAITAVTLLLCFSVVIWSVRSEETRDLDQVLHEKASQEVSRIERQRQMLVKDRKVVVPEDHHAKPHYVAVYDRDQRVLASTDSFGARVPELLELLSEEGEIEQRIRFDLMLGDEPLRGVALPLGDSGHTLIYAASRGEVDHDTRFLYRTLSVIFVVAIASCWLVTRWVSRRITADIQAISGVAHQVALGRFEARVGHDVRGSVETQQLAADLDHMITRLDALMVAQRTFISHAAHELRSPLTTLRGELQLALRRPRDGEAYRATLESVLGEVEALTRLAEDLLSLARLQADSDGIEGEVALGPVLSGALRMSSGLIAERGVNVVVSPEEALEETRVVLGSLPELIRALRNLVDNAVTHSPTGGRVALTVEAGDSHVRVVVDDEGPGVSAEEVESIFTPFYRGARRRVEVETGAGLGLSIARQIARASGGDVLYEGTPRGARFVLELRASNS